MRVFTEYAGVRKRLSAGLSPMRPLHRSFFQLLLLTGALSLSSPLVPDGRVLGKARAQFARRSDFTEAERRKLAAGELVTRRATERRGSYKLIGGTAWQVINARPAVVWRALLDTKYYRRTLPQVLEARVVEKKKNRRTLYVKQGNKLINVFYHLEVKLYPGRRDITFAVDESRPHTLRTGWGFYTVRPYGEKRTVLAYGIMADIGEGIVSSIVRAQVHEWMLKVPWMVKRFVEGSGRWIYR
jgi:ribosome-associated toxin RatA of RatAB toxin-antitoxin module